MEDKKLCLLSPYGGPSALYNWPMWPEKLSSKPDGSIEIIETIRWSFEDLPDLREAIRDELTEFTVVGDMKSYDSMKSLCEKYNSALRDILAHAGPAVLRERGRASAGLLKHIITKSYNQAVEDPATLNEYKSWSPEVYGETSFDFIAQLLDTANLCHDDVFIDLGSGVGQVVLQVAASVDVKLCVGIEKADVPFRYSQQLDRHFRFWMEWFGKTYSNYKLDKGDFFEHRFRRTITNATVIFVNNYAFGPKVDHNLKIMFEDLKDGARIFSSKAFSPANFRITDRNLNDIGSVLNVHELQPAIKGSVSWTDNSVSYYCHTVDRTKLEKYFNSMKNTKKTEQEKAAGRRVRSHGSETSTDSSNDSSSFSPSSTAAGSTGKGKEQRSGGSSSSISSSSNNNNSSSNNNNSSSMKTSGSRDGSPVFFGPTTRRAWKEQTSDPHKQTAAPHEPAKGQAADRETGGKCRKQVKERQRDPEERRERPAAVGDRSGNEENENQPVAANLTKKQRGRPRKDASGVAAAAKVVKRATKNGAVKVAGVNEPTRRPGRPPKKKPEADILDMLHQQTLMSIHNRTGMRLSPSPGCVDRKLSHEQDPPAGVPSVIITDSSDLSVSDKLDNIMSCWKQAMQQFLSYMQLPCYKETLTKQIEEEKAKREGLKKQVDAMERSVKGLQEKGTTALKAKLSELGIAATTSDGVLAVGRSLIAQNKLLLEKEMVLQAAVAREEMLYNEICKVYDKDRDKRMDRRLFSEIASTMEKKRRLSVDIEKMESSVSNLEKFSLPAAAFPSAGTPSPSTSTLSSLGSLSPRRRSNTPDAKSAAKSSAPSVHPRVPQSLQHKQSPAAPVQCPNASDQIGSLIVAELNSNKTDLTAKTKESKPKKEAKKRVSLKREAKSQASFPNERSVAAPPLSSGPETVCPAIGADSSSAELRAKSYDLSDAKISIKSPRGSPKCRPSSPGAPGNGPVSDALAESRTSGQQAGISSDKERLTLTFVINRENNSASVKSPIKDSGGGGRGGAADRSPCNSASPAKNSPKSEPAKRKLSVTSSAKRKKQRSSRSSGPDTSSESETKLKIKFGGGTSEPVARSQVLFDFIAQPSSTSTSPVVGMMAAAHHQSPSQATEQPCTSAAPSSARRAESSFERLLEIAANEREQNNRMEQANRSREQEKMHAQESVTRLVPASAPSPSSVASSRSTAAASFPSATGLAPHSDLPVAGKQPQLPSPTPISAPNRQPDSLFSHLFQQQQRETAPMSSLQSMKNLASLTSSLSPAAPLHPEQPPPPPKRKPGRPPKKSISAESWISCQQVADVGPSSCMQAKTLVPHATGHIPRAHGQAHGSSFASCQMTDQFVSSHNDSSIDYSLMKGSSSSRSAVSGQSSSGSSVIHTSSSAARTPPSSSPSFPNNYYPSHSHIARTYGGSQGMSGSVGQNMAHASVIRRHDSAGPAYLTSQQQPPPGYYGMISQPYPAFPIPESFQKELHRFNMMQSLTTSPKKLLRPSPLDSVCRR